MLMIVTFLVCNDEWKQPFSSIIYFIGVLMGSFFVGQIADRNSTHKTDSRRIAWKTGNVLEWTLLQALSYEYSRGKTSF